MERCGMIGERLIIRGQVQGVGFRPTVWRIATEMGLTGDVRNTSEGVEIRLWGDARRDFECRLRMELPKLARIEALERLPIADPAPARFEIASSASGTMRASVTPDAATCPDCLAEVRDAADRRYRYPFANCTNCGPRFSIVEGAPYDRTKTTMAAFAMCGHCADEYADPTDRRFHAQPVACPACGPHAWIEKPCAGPVSSETFAARDEMDAA
ncbi:MAG: carbamoyltransferase HypF, partial [Hyphomonas sp.]|nr:carbamoyltransferase HypF [Hyphomonas sp.]